ncbi:MAG: AAA family ATPase, partial [Propionibacteriaceae bacterium]|nr:AAA family ATPase [Propionibacteriaceae bacterium]
MTRSYLPRIADDELSERLNRIGAVLIEGAKGCGKTETARQLAASEVRLDVNETIRETAKIAPLKVLAGPTPRLIDEWQLAPQIWNAVRREVDDRGADGLFILTGSASPADDQTRHTGAARFSRLRMRTLSLAESSLSSQDVSLKELLSGAKNVSGQSTLTLDDIIEETCHGGWPGDRQRSLLAARRNVTEYVNEIAFGDIKMADSVRHDPVRVLAVMRALARNTATEAALTTLAADTGENDPMHPDTVGHYIRALERLMVLEPLLAWHPVLRSKARVRTSAKHHFVDPAMTDSLLRAGPEELSLDLKTFGLLFESLVLRDLR